MTVSDTTPLQDDAVVFREQCSRHFQYLVSIMPELIGALADPRHKIIETQTKRLRALLQYASEHSPWHRSRLAGIDPSTATAADLARIPAMTKRDLMEHWDGIVTKPGAKLDDAQEFLKNFTKYSYFLDDCILITSGGTSGRPGIFLYDWHGWAANWGSMARGLLPVVMKKLGKKPSAVRAASVGVGFSPYGSSLLSQTFASPEQRALSFPITRPLPEIVSGLNDAQPEMFYCLSSVLPVLCHEAEQGRLRISPQILFCASEALTDEDRKRAEKIFGAIVLTCWGASEAGGTFPCAIGDGGFHISEDLVVIEPVDERGQFVPEGTKSAAILVTNLFNHAMPLIRYKIDDIFELAPGQCRCGSQYKKVKKVHGRVFEIFYYGDIAVHPGIFELPIVEAGVTEYQMRQTPTGADVVIVSETEIDGADVATSMESILRELGIAAPRVRITRVDHIERTIGSKLRRYIPIPREEPHEVSQ